MLRAFATRWPTGQAQSIQKFYDRLQELETKVSTLRFEGRYPGRAPGAPELTPQEDAELRRLRTANKRLRRLNQAIRAVESSNVSPEQKRQQIDDYMLQMLEIARETLGKPKANFPRQSAPRGNLAPAPGVPRAPRQSLAPAPGIR